MKGIGLYGINLQIAAHKALKARELVDNVESVKGHMSALNGKDGDLDKSDGVEINSKIKSPNVLVQTFPEFSKGVKGIAARVRGDGSKNVTVSGTLKGEELAVVVESDKGKKTEISKTSKDDGSVVYRTGDEVVTKNPDGTLKMGTVEDLADDSKSPKLMHEKSMVFDAGDSKGLAIIGTESAPSRRIDQQMIGRAGRKGAETEFKNAWYDTESGTMNFADSGINHQKMLVIDGSPEPLMGSSNLSRDGSIQFIQFPHDKSYADSWVAEYGTETTDYRKLAEYSPLVPKGSSNLSPMTENTEQSGFGISSDVAAKAKAEFEKLWNETS